MFSHTCTIINFVSTSRLGGDYAIQLNYYILLTNHCAGLLQLCTKWYKISFRNPTGTAINMND